MKSGLFGSRAEPRASTSRRSFVRGVGASLALAPFINAINLSRARAAAQKRLMFVYVPDGCIPSKWHPTGGETSFTLPEMSAPLDPIKKHLVFVDGLTMYSGGATHEGGAAKVLTGVGAQSIDIFLGEKIGAASPFRSLQLGVGATFENGSGSISFIGDKQPVNPDDDPTNAFKRIFGAAAGGSGADADLEKLRKMSVLDAIKGDLSALKQQLGTTEKQKLDVHTDSLREVEMRLMGGGLSGAMGCGMPMLDTRGFSVIPTDYYPKTYHKEANFKTIGQMQMDVAVLALSCGATNVATLMWSHAVSPTHILETGVTTGNHDASHYGEPNSQNAKDFVTLKRWFMDQFVYLIQRMENTPDDGGSLLTNTLVVLCTELGDGNLHDHDRVPFVLAGQAGGALRTGRYLDYRTKNKGKNEPHTKLLTSIANAVDVKIDSFGYAGEGTGPLNGLLG
jgi:hypothetical protein